MHWTKRVVTERDHLELAFDALVSDVRKIVASRFTKEQNCPSGGEYALGYIAACKEIDLRVSEAISTAQDTREVVENSVQF